MAVLVTAIHVVRAKIVDGRNTAGHDGRGGEGAENNP